MAVIQRDEEKKWRRRVYSTPRADEHDPKNRGYDVAAMAKLIRDIRTGHECYACMEQVNSREGEGHVGAFSFGFGWGVWQGILAAHQIERHFVDPRKWKNSYPLPYKMAYEDRKEDARQLAIAMFADCRGFLVRKKDHDRAEALLICDWFRRKHFGGLREFLKPFVWDEQGHLYDVDDLPAKPPATVA